MDPAERIAPTNDIAAYHIYDEAKGKEKGNSNTQKI